MHILITFEDTLCIPLPESETISIRSPTLSRGSIIVPITYNLNLRQFITCQSLQICQHHVRHGFFCLIHIKAITCHSQKNSTKNSSYNILFHNQNQFLSIRHIISPYLSFQRNRQPHCPIKNFSYLWRTSFLLGELRSTRTSFAPTNKSCRVLPFETYSRV